MLTKLANAASNLTVIVYNLTVILSRVRSKTANKARFNLYLLRILWESLENECEHASGKFGLLWEVVKVSSRRCLGSFMPLFETFF